MTLRLTPYLVMAGDAQEAIDFYQQALGAQILGKQTFAEMPENPEYPIPEEAKNRIGHAMIRIGESDLMISDTYPGQSVQKGNQVTICIDSGSVEKSKELFEALQQGGTVKMPLQETFFSPAYGEVLDKFGITFQIYTEGKQHC